MSLFFRSQRAADLSALEQLTAQRLGSASSYVQVTSDSAMRHSAVWAALRLRADLISTLPVDVYRRVGGVQVETPKPAWLTAPAPGVDITEWLYSSQFDLDRFGNAYGLVTARDGTGLPAQVELVAAETVSVHVKGGHIDHYRIRGETVDPSMVWHERQYTVPGLAVGLSPLAFAAWSVGAYLSAQAFALDWFGSGAAPTGHLRNTARTLTQDQAAEAKTAYKRAMAVRDILVTGSDWTFDMAAVPANTVMFLDQMKYGVSDVARFFGVPADLIDGESGSASITYANVTQRNLQLLILNLGPVIVRRERALSAALPQPRFVKLNTDALLRMDPAAREAMLVAQVAGRTLAPSEARALDNRAPFTAEQLAEFDALFGARAPQTPKTGVPA